MNRILAVGIAAATLVISAGGVHAESHATDVQPFRLSVQGTANPVATANPCILTNSETAAGNELRLGAITLQASEVIDLCANPQAAEIHGEATLTTSTGDRLRMRYQTIGEMNPQAHQIVFGGRWAIVGGTGRFEDARGEGVLVGSGSLLPPFPDTVIFSGRLR